MNIENVIKRSNKTQVEIASAMGISKQGLSNIISKGKPTVETLRKLANAIGCHITDFFEDEEPNTNIIKCPKCGTELTLKENVPTD